MIKQLQNEKGSLMVEAAILLPVFLVGILILAYLIKGLYIQESVHAICTDQAVKLSLETALTPSLQTEHTFGLRVNQKIQKEDEETDFSISTIAIKAEEDYQLMIQYKIPMDFPVSLGGGLSIRETLVVRSWTGKQEEGIPISFSSMEQEGNGEVVWVFPHSGEKFHKEDCRYVSVYPVEKILNSQVKGEYSPCKLCGAENLENGSVVYCFEKYGNVYHNFHCSSIDRYTIQMTSQEAESVGYGKCSVCG